MQIFKRKGYQGFHPSAALTVGSYGHRAASASLAGGQGAVTYALGLQSLRESGFNSTEPYVQFGNFNADKDRFEQDSVNGSIRFEINRDWSVDAGLLHSDGLSAFDDGPRVDSRSNVRALTAHLGAKGRVTQAWQTELRVSQGNDTSNIVQAVSPGAFKTEQSQWTWQNNIDTPLGVVLAGLEQRVQKVSGSTAYTVARRTIDSAFAGINGSAGAHSWQANLRRDSNSQFDGSDTGFVGYGFRISPAWRVHASHGTSFVAPSFNQLYFPGFGNPLLQPERGRNTDLGVTFTQGTHEVKLVRFDNKIRGFMTNTTLPVNIPRARIDGWTLGYEGKVGAVGLNASFESLDPRNEVNGRKLPRRADHQLTVGADWRTGAWTFGGSRLHVGERFDDAANLRRLDAYTTGDVYADWRFTKDWSLQAKLNNLSDERYETAYGYRQPGRAFYLTLRWQPK